MVSSFSWGFFLLLHLHFVLLLLGFFFILGSIYLRPLLFDFQSIWATTRQSQAESVHNFIIKVGFFFLWRCFSWFLFYFLFCFVFFFFFWFLKKNHVGLWRSGFLLLCSVGLLLLCSTGFLLLGLSSLFCWVSFFVLLLLSMELEFYKLNFHVSFFFHIGFELESKGLNFRH